LRHRLETILRRRHSRDDVVVRLGELPVDPARRKVMVGDREPHLARKEFVLLRVLAGDPTRVFSKDELLRAVWGLRHSPGRTRTLDSHASRLRRKLDPDHRRFVVNCWGSGYRLLDSLDDADRSPRTPGVGADESPPGAEDARPSRRGRSRGRGDRGRRRVARPETTARRPMSDHTQRFAENVRRLRRRAGISAGELAERAGVDRTHVGSIENGRVEPRLGTLIRLIGALGTTPDEILDGITWRAGEEGRR
jgi:DNA-binding winged helix-turn-helix (wHTH) protein/DNA-binding XRE family transcriptional regulator